MALVTSKGTMDKENSNVRKYIAQRAELLGAIRLPNDTFKGNAGTEVVSDILFLQKRDRLIDIEPDWVHLDTDENGIRMNSYFVQHPEMILGEMKMVSGRFGPEATCEPFENADLSELLNEAVSNIHGEISEYEVVDELEEEDNSIPADPTVRNFSYTILDDKIYFRENSRMSPVEVSATAENRIKGMIGIRDCVRNLIELQTEDYPDSEIKQAQEKLNTLYDSFTKKYGLINSRANTSAFSDDSSYALLSALEVLDENGELERKADMFFKRTIKPHNVNHTLVYYDHRTDGSKRGCYFNINTTKTPAGKRQVPMLDFVKEAFLMEKERQELLDIHCEAVVDGYTDFIFLNRFGQPQHQATLNKAIRRIIRDCNDEQLLKDENAKVLLPHFSCHSLRHTFTTRMCEAGVNVKVIQDTLGHKDISTTLNIYTDVTKELRRSEFEGLDSYFKNEYNKANEVL